MDFLQFQTNLLPAKLFFFPTEKEELSTASYNWKCPIIDCTMPLHTECFDSDNFENECYEVCPFHGIIDPL